MHSYFRALAVDYDNTLTIAPRPSEEVLAAIRDVRNGGRRVVLVTGRILAELRVDFPDVDRHFDAIVGENGAIMSLGGVAQALALPVDPALEQALARRGVPVRGGHVILATEAAFDIQVIEEIARLGLEAQMVFNRSALMVLPHDVTKGSGTARALAALGISPHNTVAVGDAENDHSLLDACEVGVAVGNAVPALKGHADVVLDRPAGDGVVDLVRGPLQDRIADVDPKRWRIRLGAYDDGQPVEVPGSRVNLGIFGGSGHGKSYLAGLVAEQLIGLGYTVCVLDLEGDHVGLSTLHGVIAVGGHDPVPPAEQLGVLFREGLGSVVIDLSMHGLDAKRAYALGALESCRRSREQVGTPQWIVIEEAQVPLTEHGGACAHPGEGSTGLCIVSYRPEMVCRHAGALIDIELRCAEDGTATITRPGEPRRRFTPSARVTPHDRHWHKYTSGELPAYRRFLFRDIRGLTGESAGNLEEFRTEIARVRDGVLRHHAAHGDFSRWLGDLSHDERFVERIREIEAALRNGGGAEVGGQRAALVGALESCYGRPVLVDC
jgi:hydroxymethylpyrimidine pyrophosphatase-like HAD family hydrolase